MKFLLFILINFSVPEKKDSVIFAGYVGQFIKNIHTNTDSALFYLTKMDKLSAPYPNSPQRYRYFTLLGSWYNVKRQVALSLPAFQKAAEIAKALAVEEFIVKSKFNLSATYGEMGNYDSALAALKEVEFVLSQSKENYDPPLTNQLWANMTSFYIQTNEISKAFDYSAKLGDNLKNHKDSCIYFLTRLDLLNKANRYTETIKAGKEALKANQSTDMNYLYQINTFMGIAYNGLDDPYNAHYYLNRAKMQSAKLGIESTFIEINLGRVFYKKKEYRKAAEHYHKVLTLAEKQGSLKLQVSALNELSQSYRQLGFYERALDYRDKFVILNDSLIGQEQKKVMAELETRYELKEKERTIKEHEGVNALQKELLNSEHQKLRISIVMFILTLLLLVLVGINYRRKMRTNKLLTKQREQTETYATELKKSNIMKDKLFAIISHDLRSPVNNLIVSLNTADTVKSLPNVLQALSNIQLILNNLLKWAQLQLITQKPRFSKVYVETLIRSVIEQLSIMADYKDIHIIARFRHRSELWVDEENLQIIIRNILSNAIKFTPNDGYIKILTTEENDTISIDINDSGIGMTQDQLNSLFDFPEPSLGTGGETGSGLGLSLTRDLISNSHGNITVKSKPEAGTHVRLTFQTLKSKPISA